MSPHHMMPGDSDAIKDMRLADGTSKRVWDVRPSVPRDDHHLPRGDPGSRAARTRSSLRRPRDHRPGHSRRRSRPDLRVGDDRGVRRARRCGARDPPALVLRSGRRGSHLRPPQRAVRQGAATPDRVLHPHPDRVDHVTAQHRRHRRPDRRDQHARERREQHRGPHHDVGGDDRARVATHALDADRAAAVHRSGTTGGQATAGHLARADGLQRRDEHADDRAIQRVRRDARQAVRVRRSRAGLVRATRGGRARHGDQRGDVRTGVLRCARARRCHRYGGDLRRRRPDGRRRRHQHRHPRRAGSVGDACVPTADRADQRPGRPDDVDGQFRAGVRGARRSGSHPGEARRRRPGRPGRRRRVR